MDIRNIASAIAYWMLPRGLYDILCNYNAPKLPFDGKKALLVANRNSYYKDIHKGKRCFILCNGPSVNRQNLIPLKNEVVFSVSSGYLHKDYDVIRPQYHCSPQFTYTDIFTKDVAVKYLKEMEEKTHDAELFLNYTEEPLVRENNLFPNKRVNYLCMWGAFMDTQSELIDITRAIPRVQSVPIMCLIIAMYMGFKKIYLIGTEHDSFRTGEYKYFYESSILTGKDWAVQKDGKISCSLYDELWAYATLWQQYRILKRIATSNNIFIYNATLGGVLDEFERVHLEEVIEHREEVK